MRLPWGLSTFDIRHNFIFSGVFTSPAQNWLLRGISLSPVVFIRSGIPFTITTGTDVNGDTRNFNDRLYYIGRNTGIGPNYRSVDLRLTKPFYFKSDSPLRLDFIVEATNLFNRTNYSAVQDIITPVINAQGQLVGPADYLSGTVRLEGRKDRNSALGEPLSFRSAFDPRRIQFGLKFVF